MDDRFDVRDALLLAFAELGSLRHRDRRGSGGRRGWCPCRSRPVAARAAPYGLGSYVFWLGADEHLLAGGGMPPLYTSGAEVDVALAAALAHQGLAHQGLAEPRPDGSARPEHAHPADVVDLT